MDLVNYNTVLETGDTTAAIVGVIITGVAGFLKWLIPWMKRNSVRRTSVKEMRAIQKIYATMNEMVDETTAERVVIFAGHDSGDIPKVGSPYYTSSIYWHVKHDKARWGDKTSEMDKQTHQDVADYKEIAVDGEYVKMLIDVSSNNVVVMKTEEMKDCMLKSLYEMEGIVDSMIYGIGFLKKNFLYISMATFHKEGFSDDEIVRLKLKANQIKREFGLK